MKTNVQKVMGTAWGKWCPQEKNRIFWRTCFFLNCIQDSLKDGVWKKQEAVGMQIYNFIVEFKSIILTLSISLQTTI